MPNADQYAVMRLDHYRYALPLATVERVLRAVAITPLPGAPASVRGVVDIQGQLVPVLDLRARFGLPPQPLLLSDQLVLVRTAERLAGLYVDAVEGVLTFTEQQRVEAATLVPDGALVDAVVQLPDGLVLIHDVDRFLAPAEQRQLAALLPAERRKPA